MKSLLIVALFALTAVAQAADLTITWPVIAWGWPAVTALPNGQPIPAGATVTYNLYGSLTKTGPWTKVSVNGLSYVAQGAPIGDYCYYLTSVINGVESPPGEVDCSTVTGS